MSFPETGITVSLRLEAARVAAVSIHSARLVQASRLLAGRHPEQVAQLLPSLYALCGTAQALAGAMALEDAAGIVAAPAQAKARRILVLVESLTEHAQSILRDWAALAEEAPDLAAIKPLRPLVAAAKRAMFPDGDWARPGGGRLVGDRVGMTERIRQLKAMISPIFGDAPPPFDGDLDDFLRWIESGTGLPARLLRRIIHAGLADFGHVEPRFMPAHGPEDLADRLDTDRDGRYVARPDWRGLALESTPLSRRNGHPLIAALTARHGAGLLTRLVARLVEIAAALREVEDLVQDLSDARPPPAPQGGSGVGLGRVEAARGLLAHRVELEEGTVRRYQILAPTEWNFHPEGPLAQGLIGAEAAPDLEWRARLLAAALDPCVACAIVVSGHA